MQSFGGIQGRSPEGKPEVYFTSVIDILQAYDLGKKAENMIKSKVSLEEEISAVDPHLYKTRFLKYMNKIMTGVDGLAEELASFEHQINQRFTEVIKRKASFIPPTSTSTTAEGPVAPDVPNKSQMLLPEDEEFEMEMEEALKTAKTEKAAHAEQGGDVLYVEKLEDGTEVSILADGGKLSVGRM